MTGIETDEGRLLVLAPRGRDATVIGQVPNHSGVSVGNAGDLPALLTALDAGAGGVILPDDGPVLSDRDADVVVVGSGFIGLACALFLAREHGIKATVLEANRVARGCSTRNGGQARTLPAGSAARSGSRAGARKRR